MTQDAMRVAFEREVERLQINYVTDGDYVALYALFKAAHQSREAEVREYKRAIGVYNEQCAIITSQRIELERLRGVEAKLRDALGDCMLVIKFHVSGAACVERVDKVFSAGTAYQNGLLALTPAKESDDE